MISDYLAPAIVIQVTDKTSTRESGDEAKAGFTICKRLSVASRHVA